MEAVIIIALGLQVGLSVVALRTIVTINKLRHQNTVKKLLYKIPTDTQGNEKDVRNVLLFEKQIPFDIILSLN